jgi:replicative DNA helicase
LDLRPGRLLLLGGQPGGGKTAGSLQIVIDLLRANDAARVLVANVEMSPALLADRVLARLSGVPLADLADGTLAPHLLDRVRLAVETVRPVAERLAFMRGPFTLEHVTAAAVAFSANVIALDYIQRFGVGGPAGNRTEREQLGTAATTCRRWCDAGALVLCVSAVARQQGRTGATYAGLGLASFRGSSELEYGADSAYLIDQVDGLVNFRCVKNRNAEPRDILTAFDRQTQTFTAAPSGLAGFDATATNNEGGTAP